MLLSHCWLFVPLFVTCKWKEPASSSGGDTADVSKREFSWTVQGYIEFPMKCNCEFQSSSRSNFGLSVNVANEILWL